MLPVPGLEVFRGSSEGDDWSLLVTSSLQGTVFQDGRLLKYHDLVSDIWFVARNGEIKAGVAVLRRAGNVLPGMPFAYYQGVMFSPDVDGLPIPRKSFWLLTLTNLLLETLTREYGQLHFGLHHSITDIRGFDWFNYGRPGQRRCTITPRYTALLDCSELRSVEAVLKAGRKDRRQDLRRAQQEGLTVSSGNDVDLLLRLYSAMFERQGTLVSADHRRALRAMATAAVTESIGEILFVTDRDREPVAAQLALYDSRSGHAVANASIDDGRLAGAATMACVAFVNRVFDKKLQWADFNGANSPARADFKHSLGASPRLFFDIHL
ncbi:MAG: GNAT family N-acetyltransferase [Alphaproteobacteria bacterium]|nr:GNAT family N-acetyltransferase [Alphaproteobacteria bacterium]